MPTLTLVNLTPSRLPVGQFVGTLNPNETRQVDLSSNELELTRDQLVGLEAAGVLSWSTAPSSTDADNQAEPVVGGGRLLTGTGVPNGVAVGSIGDLYTDKAGGAATTLWVKESGAATDTGWVAK